MENLIREYLMSQPEIERVEFRYDSTYLHKGKMTLFEGCQIRIYRKTTYIHTKGFAQTLNSMFDLGLGETNTKWRIVTF